jgi:hypothetical protein
VLVGTGTAGAYHAGVLRALREVGVRVDVVAGRGMGVGSAMFAAVDADARLWDAEGVWTSRQGLPHVYRWRPAWQVLAVGSGIVSAALALPIVLALALAALYPFVYLVHLASASTGSALTGRYVEALSWLMSPALMLGVVPRLVTAGVLVVLAVIVTVSGLEFAKRPARRSRGWAWWRALGAPLDATAAAAWMAASFWKYLRGAANVPEPPAQDLSQRYAELLRENVGQPGYRELLVAVHDLDARVDVVFALLSERVRATFFREAPSPEQRAREAVDLAGVGGGAHVMDALRGALCLVPATEPHPLQFGAEGPWRGETHRMTDRPGATLRILEELLRCGVRQVILASPDAPSPGPHALTPRALDPRRRVAEALISQEVAGVADAVSAYADRFEGFFVVRPSHNPVGPLDFAGTSDERSDRRVAIAELVARGYEDTHRQFIDPVVGASGEAMTRADGAEEAARPEWSASDLPLKTDGGGARADEHRTA